MPNASKRKGNAYERELVNQAIASGLDAKRAWGSNGESIGEHAEVDLVVEGFKIQAKRRAKLPSYLKPSEHVDAQAIREDHGETQIVITWYDFLDLLKLSRANHGQLEQRTKRTD